MAAVAFHVHDKRDAAGVVFEAWIVETLLCGWGCARLADVNPPGSGDWAGLGGTSKASGRGGSERAGCVDGSAIQADSRRMWNRSRRILPWSAAVCARRSQWGRMPRHGLMPPAGPRASAQCGVPARRRHAASGNGRAPPLAPGRALVRYDQLRPFVPAMNAVSVLVVAIDQDRPAVVAEEPGSDMLSDTPIPPVTAAAARASTRRNRRGPRRVATGFAGAAMTNSLSLLSTTLCWGGHARYPDIATTDEMDG